MPDPQSPALPPRSIDIMMETLEKDPTLTQKVAADPITTLGALADQVKRANPQPVPPSEDKFTYRVAVLVLSIVTILIVLVIGLKFLLLPATATQIEIPQALVALGSMSLGALAGLLMPSPRKS